MADYLSRHPSADEKLTKEKEEYVHLILPNLIPVFLSRKTIAVATSTDSSLRLRIQSAPSDDPRLRSYKPIFSELCMSEDGIVLRVKL